MPRVSKKRKLEPRLKSLFLDDFYSAATSLKDKKEVHTFFEDLLTTEEKLMLAKRFQVAMMLRLGWLWQEIDERAKVTLATIASVSQKVTAGLGGLSTIANRIIVLKQKKMRELSKGRSKKFLGPELIRAGLGLFLMERQRYQKQKSITK